MTSKNQKDKEKLKENEKESDFKIGNYIIKRTLGQGTFGKVKLGIYIPTREKVAVKILEKSKIIEKDDEIRVKREFEMLTKFNHINVILVTEIFESYDSYYSVMDYCEGGELFNYIVKKRRLSEEESSFFYYQIINGLEYIHSLNICHRDLKPENLLLTKDHILKIIDFGLSNYFYDKNKLLSTPCGSPCYASPEMVSGKKYNGFKIDIWSSGIVLYAMLCGFLPFEDKDNEILFKKIRKCKLEFPHHISLISKDLIRKILVTNPDKRIGIKEIKKHPFFLKGKTIFNQTFSFKKLPKDLSLDKDDIKNNRVKTEENDFEKSKSKNKSKDDEKKNKKNENKNKNNIEIIINDNEINNNNDKIDKENEEKEKNDKENNNDNNNDNSKITKSRYELNNGILNYSEKISKTEPNSYQNNINKKNKKPLLSSNQQNSSTISRMNNYSNDIHSMRIPFNKTLTRKHNNIMTTIRIPNITIKNTIINFNMINSNPLEMYNSNLSISKPHSSNNSNLHSRIIMLNKNERKKPKLKFYDFFPSSYADSTVQTEKNIKGNKKLDLDYLNYNNNNQFNINGNLNNNYNSNNKIIKINNNNINNNNNNINNNNIKHNSLKNNYKNNIKSQNPSKERKKHLKIKSMKLNETSNLHTKKRKNLTLNTINNSNFNKGHFKLSSYQTTSSSIEKNRNRSKSKQRESIENKIKKISYGSFLKFFKNA